MKPESLKYFSEMEQLQENVIALIENDDNTEENFKLLTDNITKFGILTNEPLLVEFLHLIVNISNNHNRNLNFFAKIERILKLFKDQITNIFSNLAILYFFISNRRLVLFLIKEGILTFDSTIYHSIKKIFKIENDDTNSKILSYFYEEVKPFMTVKNDEIEENLSLFEERRTIGENHHSICKIIRDDLIDDFIIYVNQNSISIESEIESSIYETNEFLMEKTPKLIEYAAFNGSIQIFNYLKMNGVELNSNLWNYAVHSNNAEILSIIENSVQMDSIFYFSKDSEQMDPYLDCLKESIKCHHNLIAKYIIENLFNGNFSELNSIVLKSFNYSFMNENKLYPDIIATFAFDYSYLAELVLNYIDVNEFISKPEIKMDAYKHEGKYYPFIIAISNGNYEIVKILLKQKNIDVNRIFPGDCNGYQTTALFKAIEVYRPDIVELLLNNEKICVNLELNETIFLNIYLMTF